MRREPGLYRRSAACQRRRSALRYLTSMVVAVVCSFAIALGWAQLATFGGAVLGAGEATAQLGGIITSTTVGPVTTAQYFTINVA